MVLLEWLANNKNDSLHGIIRDPILPPLVLPFLIFSHFRVFTGEFSMLRPRQYCHGAWSLFHRTMRLANCSPQPSSFTITAGAASVSTAATNGTPEAELTLARLFPASPWYKIPFYWPWLPRTWSGRIFGFPLKTPIKINLNHRSPISLPDQQHHW